MTARAILHVDMDAFYAAVEVLDEPRLAGQPVIVGGTPEGRGVVAAASYEARRYGIRSAMPAAQAIQRCPHGVFLRPRMARYVEVSERIFAIMREYTPLVEPLSIDEAFLDVTGSERLFGSAETIGRALKQRIRDEVGLTASVGVAANKFLAKLASELEKPDGFVVIRADEARERLAGLPVGKLWGVGKVTERELHGLGVHSIGDLVRAPRAVLDRCFGDHAAHLLELAAGRDERPVVPVHEAKSLGNEITFAEDIADASELCGILDLLAEKVAWRLRRHGLRGRTVTLKARYPDFSTHTRSRTLPQSTQSTTAIRAAARELLERQLGRRGRPLRLIGVTVSQFDETAAVQGQLFGDPTRAREEALDRIVDRINERFGKVLRRGGPPRPDSPE
ncbi:MAG TPA: DNA polymerase IV [Candidatus Krumholzibacteria bacterium]|nr:DNA polymerase IV [Candidatus Krumholzibacteria bacterium]HPD72618.1 DNA polymerase IV [Candidatus Krumholzibacteria bacterium]HRY40450.1 DNA polymerase IV [Candidatus Krumholzibacteria bacterium]